MILELYADESGTHHPTGNEPNSEVPVLAGYMARRDEWERFDLDWRAVLCKYGVSTFHAKEFERAREFPYNTWDISKAEAFKYELAEIAGRQIPIGGGYHIKEHHRRHPEDTTYPYIYAIHNFFNDLVDALEGHKIVNETISLIFDIKTDKQWDAAIREEIELFKKHGLGIGTYVYGDDEKILPLQAADMYAHRARSRHWEKLQRQAQDGKDIRLGWTVFDVVLNRNIRPNRRLRPVITPELVNEMWELSGKHPSVQRALHENTSTYFALKNEQRRREAENAQTQCE